MTHSRLTWQVLRTTNDHRQGYDYTGMLQATGYPVDDLHGIPGLFLVAKEVFRVGYLSTLSALLLEFEASFFGTAYAPNKNN